MTQTQITKNMNDITALKKISSANIVEYIESKTQELTDLLGCCRNDEELILFGYNTVLSNFLNGISTAFVKLAGEAFASNNSEKMAADESFILEGLVSSRLESFISELENHMLNFKSLDMNSRLDSWISEMENFYRSLCTERTFIQAIYCNRKNNCETSINRALAVESRKSMIMVSEFNKAGIDFVAVPCMNDDHKKKLLVECDYALSQIGDAADGAQKERH